MALWQGPCEYSTRTHATASLAAEIPASGFLSDADHAVFLEFLERSAGIYETEILAYVLMSNHFHLKR
jgi:hypothetical protein